MVNCPSWKWGIYEADNLRGISDACLLQWLIYTAKLPKQQMVIV